MGEREIVKTADVRVRVMALKPGASIDWHHHNQVNDLFVCLKGSVQVEMREPYHVVVLQPGEMAEVVSPVVHRVTNQHPEPAEYLLVQGVGAYDLVKAG